MRKYFGYSDRFDLFEIDWNMFMSHIIFFYFTSLNNGEYSKSLQFACEESINDVNIIIRTHAFYVSLRHFEC